MNKIWLIIQREFSTRVRKRSFLVMTVLGPLLISAIFLLPIYMATRPKAERIVMVLDKPILMNFDKGKNNIRFQYLSPKQFNLKSAKAFFKESGHYGFLYIPDGGNLDPDFITSNITLYTDGDVDIGTENYISNKLEKYIQIEKLKAEEVDPAVLARTKTKVNINTINISDNEEKESNALAKMGIGYICGFLIYIFVFLYGAQIMRGVIEEKTNRIVEVMISSVKPFQLMLGKIFGVGGVALLQFLIWIIFGIGIYLVIAVFFFQDALDPEVVASSRNMDVSQSAINEVFNTISQINFPYIIGCFIFYFLFGYLLYAALFAAIGSAVDKESDTQQFMLPVSLPLIASIVMLFSSIDDPNGDLAFWFSMFPLTSPVIMMARIPFNVPIWQLATSMIILVGSFLLFTWVAGKIYRTGILMYGKKPRLKELIKWISYKN